MCAEKATALQSLTVAEQQLGQLRDSFLMLQQEWQDQKERLMAAEIEAARLRSSCEEIQRNAAVVS